MYNNNARTVRRVSRSGAAPKPSFGIASTKKTVVAPKSKPAPKLESNSSQQKRAALASDGYVESKRPVAKSKKRKVSLTKLVVIMCLIFAVTFTLFRGSSAIGNKIAAINNGGKTSSLPFKVSSLIKLRDTNPKIYKVQDTAPLKNKSAFYEAVMPGDYVLVYNLDQKVLIYRETDNMIVNIDSVSNL